MLMMQSSQYKINKDITYINMYCCNKILIQCTQSKIIESETPGYFIYETFLTIEKIMTIFVSTFRIAMSSHSSVFPMHSRHVYSSLRDKLQLYFSSLS